MPPTDDIDVLRRKLAHADAVIAELRGAVAELRKQIEAQQAHIHRLRYPALNSSRTSLDGLTGTTSNSARSRHWRTHCMSSRASSRSMSWKQRSKFTSTQLSTYRSPSGSDRPDSRTRR